ncbi:MAG: NAD-dependent succinate-semialdehyde dehydrogenase [Bacteroidales bacterium]|nr:NAD-dependent succinate-semialdehyde dehydrogenase [Bacteroidales bacterium]
MKSINPFNNKLIQEYIEHSISDVDSIINDVNKEWLDWKSTSFTNRSKLMMRAGEILRSESRKFAKLITSEMGKVISQSLAEIEKCAALCDYYAEHTQQILNDEIIETDAKKSFASFEPLGCIFAIMPWNFPFWQVFRFAVPNLIAGNAAILKHAPNVCGCSLAIEKIFQKAGFPKNIFRSLIIPVETVERVIASDLVAGVTLTGSAKAGSIVASQAGKYLKKSVLELGGSDPFIVLKDADLKKACRAGTDSRLLNAGQVCISAKRFIIKEEIAEEFIENQKSLFENYKVGDPMKKETEMGPIARLDLLENINHQVQKSIEMGAKLICGGEIIEREGFFYQPTILTNVKKGMPVYDEETFGPVSVIIPVKNVEEAIKVANDTIYGLGASIWTSDLSRGEAIARKIEAGAVFVNGMTKSDARMPFGGIKKSGYGRELASYGIKEFLNIKTIWIGGDFS